MEAVSMTYKAGWNSQIRDRIKFDIIHVLTKVKSLRWYLRDRRIFTTEEWQPMAEDLFVDSCRDRRERLTVWQDDMNDTMQLRKVSLED